METLEMSLRTVNGPIMAGSESPSGATGSVKGKIGKLISRYAPTVCVLEALALLAIVIYLKTSSNSPRIDTPSSKQPPEALEAPSIYAGQSKTYSNGTNDVKVIIGLRQNCNQRIHDFSFGIRCSSRDTSRCGLKLNRDQDSSLNPDPSPNGQLSVEKIVTSKSGRRLHSRKVILDKTIKCPPRSQSASCVSKTLLRVDNTGYKQKIIGWGGALTDSSINNILSLSTNGSRRLLDDYFGPDGLRFNMIRITIGGSDFSSRFYTNDDKLSPNASDDLKLQNFRLVEEDLLYKIPMLKFINENYQVAGKIKLFASMWSPPTWMKTNDYFNKGYLKGKPKTGSILDTDWGTDKYYKALAELKRQFLLAYRNNSIEFWGLTVMNEPIFAQQPFLDFNTMIFPRQDYSSYLFKYLGRTLKKDASLANIKIMIHDDNRRFLLDFSQPILDNESSKKYVDGVSVHGYIDQEYEMMDTVYDSNIMKHEGSFFVLPTELCSGHLPWMEKAMIGNWHRGVHYALDIIRSLQHSAAGWVDWNMVLDTKGGPGWLGGKLDSPIIVDKSEDAYYKSPMYFVLGHFSRYIPPDSVRLHHTIENSDYDGHFETVTFALPDGNKYATVVLNNNPYPVELNIMVDLEDIFHQFDCLPDSVTTFIYKKLH